MKPIIYFLGLAIFGLLYIETDAVGENVKPHRHRSIQQYKRNVVFDNNDSSFKHVGLKVEAASSTQLPTAGSSAQPTSAGSSAQPTTAGSSAQPTSTGSSTQPTTAGSSAQPTSAGSSTQPTTAGSSAQPTSTGSSTQPTTAGSSAQPTTGGSSSTPSTSVTTSPTTGSTTTIKPTPPHCTPGEMKPVNGSCRSYFECDKNYNWVETNCTTWCHNFNPSLKKCDWNWKYICVDHTTETPCTSSISTNSPSSTVTSSITTTEEPTTKPPECTKQGQQKPFQKGDCKDYLECDSGKWVKKSCSWGYDFDVNYLECRWSWWAKC